MKIHVLGCGSAFTQKNYQSNYLLEHEGKYLLFDAGSDIRFSLRDSNLKVSDIDAVYISHLHADHAGGLEYLAFSTFFNPATKGSIKLFGNKEVLKFGWEHTWSGGLRSIEGTICSLDDYFKVSRLEENGSFLWNGIMFQTVQSVHIMDGYSIVPSFGLMIYCPDSTKKIYFTADQQFCPFQIQKFYDEADIIIQDCETVPDNYASKVHAHYSFLKTLPLETKNKMYLTHYNDNVLADFENLNDRAKLDGFLGFLLKNQVLEV